MIADVSDVSYIMELSHGIEVLSAPLLNMQPKPAVDDRGVNIGKLAIKVYDSDQQTTSCGSNLNPCSQGQADSLPL